MDGGSRLSRTCIRGASIIVFGPGLVLAYIKDQEGIDNHTHVWYFLSS
jgi:hypothetical protein